MYKVLIVDDEPMVIHGLCRQIDWESYALELAGTADSGERALTILKKTTIDILFTDIGMPRMDGLSLIAAAKQENPFLRSVIISSHNEFEYVKKALLLGVENYLLKPIDQMELEKTLEKTIDNLNRDRLGNLKDAPDPAAFRSNVLDRWVNADIEEYEFYERAELLHINLAARQYQIGVIDHLAGDSERHRQLALQALLEQCRNSFTPAFAGECFIDRFNRITILFYSDHLENEQHALEVLLNSLITTAAGNGNKIFISLGPVASGIAHVAQDYSDAIKYLNYQLIDPDANMLGFGDLVREFNSAGQEPVLLQFANTLTEEDPVKTNDLANSLLDGFTDLPIEAAKRSLIPFLILLLARMNDSGHRSEMLPLTVTSGFAGLKGIASRESLGQWFSDLIRLSFDMISKRQESLHLLVRRTLDLIKKNYHQELSLKTIAADFKASPVYLGQLFREETGKYFRDYLTETRLQAARVLLLETDLKILEILYHIGIPNQSYFNRIFKKAYGLSPLDFRYQKDPKRAVSQDCL